jgi:superfamily I DNA and/or RNA helicase
MSELVVSDLLHFDIYNFSFYILLFDILEFDKKCMDNCVNLNMYVKNRAQAYMSTYILNFSAFAFDEVNTHKLEIVSTSF